MNNMRHIQSGRKQRIYDYSCMDKTEKDYELENKVGAVIYYLLVTGFVLAVFVAIICPLLKLIINYIL